MNLKEAKKITGNQQISRRWSERELTPSRLAWPMHPEITPTHLEAASRSEILDRARPQAIYNSSRPQACRALTYKRARPQALHPTYKQSRAQALRRTHKRATGRKLGGWGRGGGRFKSPCTQREGGEGRDSHPLYAPNTYIFITASKKYCF